MADGAAVGRRRELVELRHGRRLSKSRRNDAENGERGRCELQFLPAFVLSLLNSFCPGPSARRRL